MSIDEFLIDAAKDEIKPPEYQLPHFDFSFLKWLADGAKADEHIITAVKPESIDGSPLGGIFADQTIDGIPLRYGDKILLSGVHDSPKVVLGIGIENTEAGMAILLDTSMGAVPNPDAG